MRILHVVTRFRRGGAERNIVHTTEWERDQGHEVHLAVGRDSLPDLIPPGIQVHRLDDLVRAMSPRSDLAGARAIRRLAQGLAADVVHTHQSKAGIIGRLGARGLSAAIVHTVHMASFGPSYGHVASPLFLSAERLCVRSTDAMVTVGSELRQMYLAARVGKAEQYVVIHSPLDVAAFVAIRSMPPSDFAEARQRLGITGAVPVAAVIASLEPRKRVDLIIESLASMLRSGSLALVIAGDGPDLERLTSLAEVRGVTRSVRFLRHVEDVASVIAAADVLVHAATVEGVPQVVIQALAAGKPIVATDMIGLREIPGAPILVASDAAGLAESVRAALADPPAPLAVEALRPWTVDAVDEGLNRLHDRIRTVLAERHGATS